MLVIYLIYIRALIFMLFLGTVCQAQIQSTDLQGAKVLSTRINNSSATGKKNEEKLKYSEIKGNCFSDKEWNAALLVLKMGGDIKLRNVKLNLHTNDIHYLDNTGKELVALNGVSKVIFFDKKDTAKVSAVFQWFANFSNKNKEAFGQVLAEGEIQFVKNYLVSLGKQFDSGNPKPKYRFKTVTDYFIIDHGNMSHLKRISKTAILAIIKPTREQDEWLQSNKNKLKDEADVIAFITFCNNSLKTQ